MCSCSHRGWEERESLKLKLPDQDPSSSPSGRVKVRGCSNLRHGGDAVASGMVPVSGPGPSEPGASCIPSACIPASPCAGGQQTWGAPWDAHEPPTASSCFAPLGDSLRAWRWLQGRWGQQPPGQYQSSDSATGPSLQLGAGQPSPVSPSPPPPPNFASPNFAGCGVGTGGCCHRCHPPPLLMSSLFLPRDSGISAGLGGEEGQKPLPCQKKKGGGSCFCPLSRRGWIINLSLCPSVPLPALTCPMTWGCDTFPVT